MASEFSDDTEASRYELREDGELVSFLTYRRSSDGMIALTHAETMPEHGGRGHAGRLTEHAIEQARASGTPVVPTCGYVRHWMLEHPETIQLVPERYRAQLGLAG